MSDPTTLLSRLRQRIELHSAPLTNVEALALIECAQALIAARDDLASYGILRPTHPASVALANLEALHDRP